MIRSQSGGISAKPRGSYMNRDRFPYEAALECVIQCSARIQTSPVHPQVRITHKKAVAACARAHTHTHTTRLTAQHIAIREKTHLQ